MRRDERLLATRLRTGLCIILVTSSVFAVADLALARRELPALLAVKSLQLGMLTAAIWLLGRALDPLRVRLLGVLATSAVYVTTALSAILRGDLVTTCFLLLGAAMGSATFVPWGGRAQLATVAVGGLAIAGNAYALGGLPGGGPQSTAVFMAIAMLATLFGSVWIAFEHERHRTQERIVERELEASRRRSADESWLSGALARVGREMISSIDSPELLDRLCQLTVELLGCDSSHTVLLDPRDRVFVPRASSGVSADDWETMRVLRFPVEMLAPLLDFFDGDRALRVRTDRIGDATIAQMHSGYGVTMSLYMPLRRGREVIGVLSAHYRRPGTDFSRLRERLAAGIAHLASMALENARLVEELRAANQLKSEFVSTMSHELRTPVSVILGYAEMAEDASTTAERASLLARIRRSGLELLDLIEETLNLNRLEAGKDPPRVEPVEVRGLFEELAGEFAALSSADPATMRWEGPPVLRIASDRRKLRIILKNLLGNALKFAPGGDIAVRGRREPGEVVLSVSDTGIGIAPEHLPVIFEMFRQADSSDARSYRGAGLGLYIVRRLVVQLGGEVVVDSHPGRGSTFTISLPQSDSAEAWREEEGERS